MAFESQSLDATPVPLFINCLKRTRLLQSVVEARERDRSLRRLFVAFGVQMLMDVCLEKGLTTAANLRGFSISFTDERDVT